jgi:hypothetical protein
LLHIKQSEKYWGEIHELTRYNNFHKTRFSAIIDGDTGEYSLLFTYRKTAASQKTLTICATALGDISPAKVLMKSPKKM